MPREHQLRCEVGGCDARAVFHLSWIQIRRCQREQHMCEEHAQSVLLGHDFDKPVGTGNPAFADKAKCFDIDLVVISEIHDQQVVYLREVGGNRYFPILIGIFEATALDRSLKGFRAPRPLTHDAMLDAIRALDGEMEHACINDFKDHTIYTRLSIGRYHQSVIVDIRPSDAFVLAVLADKPILVLEEVLPKLIELGR